MKLHQESALVCFMFMFMIWAISCDDSSDTTGIRWTCSCSSAYQVNQITLIESNCSETCDCKSATGSSSDYKWTCACAGEELPLLAVDDHNPYCFTDCNCTSGNGFSPKGPTPRNSISGQVLFIMLLIFVVFVLAFVASIACFIHQRKKLHSGANLTDEGCSYSSDINLIRRKPSSQNKPRLSIAGCIDKVCCLVRSKADNLHGTMTQFTYSELEHATNKFSDSNLIGLGASSHVYHGQLKDGRTVAVKRLKIPEHYDADSVFLTEIELLSRLHHCHVVPLIGYCSESIGKQSERLLVFDFMPNGNLRECLDGTSGKYLDWHTRVGIALGAARGLEYLHCAAAPRILHRDVKSTNILLDENWRPKITDLGMAKNINTDGFSSCSSSPARMQGTFGYIAPEYAVVGKASLKSDVFSFGVVLLELITGRRPVYSWPGKGDESLVIWAAPRLQNSRRVISELPDPRLGGNFPEEELHIMAYLAKECLLLDPETRPSMSEVVQILLTISPDTSKRRKFTVNLFQNMPNNGIKSKPEQVEQCKRIDVCANTEEPKKVCPSAWSPRNSFPLNTAHYYNVQRENLPSDSSRTPLTHTTSRGRSCCSHQDTDSVDLTEPRFESFCMDNSGSDSYPPL